MRQASVQNFPLGSQSMKTGRLPIPALTNFTFTRMPDQTSFERPPNFNSFSNTVYVPGWRRVISTTMLFFWLCRETTGLWFYPTNVIALLISMGTIFYLVVELQATRIAIVGALVLAGLCVSSFLPIWFHHAAPAPWGLDFHWHNYWHLPHIH